MTITNDGSLVVTIEGKTKLISRQQIEIAFAEPKASCANYERDNVDPIVEAVRAKLLERSQVGIVKYGGTLESNTKDNYLNHVQMELMDACNYIEVLLQQGKDITNIVKSEPNDLELGKKVRKIYGSKI